MTTSNNDNPNQDDRVLAQLYKEGAKDEPPAKLNYEIINYAANASKSDSKSSQKNNKVGSHFGGGWKVPLSMAASVVIVFALLVQLEQSPQQLELPPIPEISIPTESRDKLFKSKTSPADIFEEESVTNDALIIEREINELSTSSDNIIDLKENQKPNINHVPSNIPSSANSTKEKQPPTRNGLILEESLDNVTRTDEFRIEDDSNQGLSTAPSITTQESKSIELSAPTNSKPTTAKKQIQKADHGDTITSSPKIAPSESMQQRSTTHEPATQSMDIDNAGATSDMTPEIAAESEQSFAPIPIENWLVMIEQLIARKDYAEAARQLKKFKYAHPEVDVEDLDTKIP
ncbi:MAG: hypothetical protein AB8B92_11380 [Gammaproteobacteria bacterium]